MPAAAPALFYDEDKKTRYLQAVADGKSRSAAAAAVSLSPAQIKTALAHDPDFARRELEARSAANDMVEDAVFNLAVGRPSKAEREWESQEMERLKTKAEREGTPIDEIPHPRPPAPSLKAAELWLSRRVPERWKDTAAPAQGLTVNVTNLTTSEGAASFRAELERRRAEALPAQEPITVYPSE